MSESLLGGFRVVETAGLPAELAGRLLADLGAEVLKLEPPAGAPTRRMPRHFFEYYNAGKRSVVADVSDGEVLRAHLTNADVWIDSLGLDTDRLATTNPRLVVARVSPFDRSGPHARYRASDLIAQAAGGMVFANGRPGETPLQGFGLQAYHAASLYTVIGILLALYEREGSGLGQTIDCNLQDAVGGALEQSTTAWNRLFRACRCRDGLVLLCLLCDWTTLVGWLSERGHGAELVGEEWQDFFYRNEHADEAFAVLERWAGELDAEEIFDGAQLRRIAFAPVRAPQQICNNPQLIAREFFARGFPGPPFRMSRTPLRTRIPPLPAGERSRAKRAGEGDTPRRPPLEAVRVLDFTHVVAGPIATRILADHGADVIKVERPTTVDVGDRRGGLFGSLNRGKRSIILDLADARDIALARRLAAASDVVIDNFSARVMPELGLDYESLRPLRRDVITIGMSGFGNTGPLRDYVSFGPTLHALSGHTAMMQPTGWGFSHSDVCAGLNGAIAAIAALLDRRRTGEGQAIDLSQLESVVSLMGPTVLDVVNGGPAPAPPQNRSQEAPATVHGVYRCTGENCWVAIAVFDDADRQRFAGIVPASRVEEWTLQRSPEEVTEICQQNGIAAFPVLNGEDLRDRLPIRLSATPGRVDRPGPLHGEHTEEVLAKLLSRDAASSANG